MKCRNMISIYCGGVETRAECCGGLRMVKLVKDLLREVQTFISPHMIQPKYKLIG
jgi:hypothetical protein